MARVGIAAEDWPTVRDLRQVSRPRPFGGRDHGPGFHPPAGLGGGWGRGEGETMALAAGVSLGAWPVD